MEQSAGGLADRTGKQDRDLRKAKASPCRSPVDLLKEKTASPFVRNPSKTCRNRHHHLDFLGNGVIKEVSTQLGRTNERDIPPSKQSGFHRWPPNNFSWPA